MQKTDESDHQAALETSPEPSDTTSPPDLPGEDPKPETLIKPEVIAVPEIQADAGSLPETDTIQLQQADAEAEADAALASDVEEMVDVAEVAEVELAVGPEAEPAMETPAESEPEIAEPDAGEVADAAEEELADPTEQAVDPVVENAIKVVPTKIPFSTFNLEPALEKGIAELGYEYCTPIQAQSLRYTLRGFDVTGKAQTGTGKTAAFLITIINDLLKNPMQDTRFIGEPRAIVLAPTRELVQQIASDAANLTKYTDLHVVTLVGGEDYQKQLRQVDKRPVDIVVATPGRLIDFLQQDHLYLGLVELLVIDEADRMLDMGFIPQVRTIVSRTPHKDCRQTLLFSATFTPEIIELTSRWAMDPIMIEIQPERVATDNVEQLVYLVTTEDKYKLLYNLIAAEGADRVIVFNNRRDQVRKLADNLYRHGVSCGLLSGEVAQNKRVRTLDDFRDGTIKVLVATDVAGRGLHIDDVTHVINYSLPEEADDYVHRIGRTGRAGSVGTSISFACEEDSFLLPNIEKTLGQKLPCVYPDASLLVEPPPFSRATHFKDESKPARSGGSSRPGQGRSGGGKPRPRR